VFPSEATDSSNINKAKAKEWLNLTAKELDLQNTNNTCDNISLTNM